MNIAKRGAIPPFLIMEALSQANDFIQTSGADVIHLSLGQPGKGIPQRVVDAAAELMQRSNLGYTEACGLRELRRKLSEHYRDTYGVDVPWERIFITVGSSSAFFLTLLAAFDAGERVALVEPCYPAYRNVIQAMGLEPVLLKGGFDNHFQPSVAMIEALEQPVQGIVVGSPSNPTGTVIPEAQFRELLDYCRERNITVISDEIYHGMVYEGEAISALSHDQNTIILNSFSKYYLMAGWRLGWVVAPQALQRSYESLLQNFFVSPPSLAQHAALKVFECTDELDATVDEYRINRDVILDTLTQLGVTRICPAEGAFYIYANVSHLTEDSAVLCREMLEQAHISAVSGHDFDTNHGHEWVRFSYSGTTGEVREAMQRLTRWFSGRS